MGFKTVRVAAEILRDWFVHGRKFPEKGCTIIQGIDPDAKIVAVSLGRMSNDIYFLFEHPDWPDIEPYEVVDIVVKVDYADYWPKDEPTLPDEGLALEPFEDWARKNLDDGEDEDGVSTRD